MSKDKQRGEALIRVMAKKIRKPLQSGFDKKEMCVLELGKVEVLPTLMLMSSFDLPWRYEPKKEHGELVGASILVDFRECGGIDELENAGTTARAVEAF